MCAVCRQKKGRRKGKIKLLAGRGVGGPHLTLQFGKFWTGEKLQRFFGGVRKRAAQNLLRLDILVQVCGKRRRGRHYLSNFLPATTAIPSECDLLAPSSQKRTLFLSRYPPAHPLPTDLPTCRFFPHQPEIKKLHSSSTSSVPKWDLQQQRCREYVTDYNGAKIIGFSLNIASDDDMWEFDVSKFIFCARSGDYFEVCRLQEGILFPV